MRCWAVFTLAIFLPRYRSLLSGFVSQSYCKTDCGFQVLHLLRVGQEMISSTFTCFTISMASLDLL